MNTGKDLSDLICPAGSDKSGSSTQSRKRDRVIGGDEEDPELPTKRNNRVVTKHIKPAKTTLDAVMSKLTDMSTGIAKQHVLL